MDDIDKDFYWSLKAVIKERRNGKEKLKDTG